MSRIQDIENRLMKLNTSITTLNKERDGLLKEKAALKQKPRVSDHAVIRYLERKYGFSFEDIRKEILSPQAIQAIEGGCKKISKDGYSFVVEGKCIVTVVEK